MAKWSRFIISHVILDSSIFNVLHFLLKRIDRRYFLMGILNSSILMKDKYDVVIIGAGLGALTAGALLAKRGIELLIIEQNYIPGGACTSFKREDRIFDSGAALFFGFGKEGFHPERILMNSLQEELEVIPREAFFRLNFEGKIITFHKDINKFIEELKKSFPEVQEQLEKFYDYLMNFYENNIKGHEMLTSPSELTIKDKLKMLFENPKRAMNMRRLLKMSAKDIMAPYIKSKRLIEFFDMLCSSYIYCIAEETPAILALTTFTDNHAGGSYYIAGSAQTYSNTLEKAIEKNGGTILYRNKVKKILFDGKKANGILLSDGTIIKAKKIISGTTVWNLYNDLIPDDLLSKKQKNWVNSLENTYPAMVLHIAVEKSVFPPDTSPVEYYVSDSSNIDMGDITMYIPTMDDHSLAPQDEHILTVFSPAPDQSWPSPNDPEYQSEDYYQSKKKQADLIIDEIEKRIPNFRKGIRMLLIASPSTIERYTLKNEGCVGGPKQSIGQDLSNRLHAKTEWKNLYACGDSTTMGMGLPAVTVSGFAVANILLREFHKEIYKENPILKDQVSSIKSKKSYLIPDLKNVTLENVKLIARLCQHCQDAPCMANCPARIDIPNFIRRIEAGNFIGATRIIRETNPLSEICGTICSPDRLCQKHCYRNTFAKEPVPIQSLHKWISSYTANDGWSNYYSEENDKNIAVIGAGPAGLTCAYFLARLGYKINLFEKCENIGGILLNCIEKKLIEKEVVEKEISFMVSKGIKIITNREISDEEELFELEKKYDAIFLTAPLSLPDEIKNHQKITLGGRWYSENSDQYEIVESVRDGRKAAQTIHKKLNNLREKFKLD
ncbi:MAG: hypothetical protein EU533_01345 [Promethearchaeota archaeon]|nr:MAG: hypothetical protein EU533_01345 [Candidatus Lokiarchaeota archaeon]